jgi:hypothetical protein
MTIGVTVRYPSGIVCVIACLPGEIPFFCAAATKVDHPIWPRIIMCSLLNSAMSNQRSKLEKAINMPKGEERLE